MSNHRSTHQHGLLALLIDWRHRLRKAGCHLLARLFGTTRPRRRPLAPDTRRILIVRMNRRLGNILFLTPLLSTLKATLPDAEIDILVHNDGQQELLGSLPGLGQVHVRGQHPLAMLRTTWQVRRVRYDLIIDPVGNSTSNRVGMVLARARQRMGFARRDQWLRLTHAAGRPHHRHQALQAVEMLADAVTRPSVHPCRTLAIDPPAEVRHRARQYWRQIPGIEPDSRVIGFFRHATGAKALPEHWWQDWLRRIQHALPQVQLLEILPHDGAEPLTPDMPHVAIASLPELAAFMRHFDDFLAADSGPMHLAAAAGTPVLGLFRTTSPRQYAPLGHDCETLGGNQFLSTEHVCRRLIRRRQARHEWIHAEPATEINGHSEGMTKISPKRDAHDIQTEQA